MIRVNHSNLLYKSLFSLLFFLLVSLVIISKYDIAFASEKVQCTIIAENNIQMGDPFSVSYSITGGSGRYSNLGIAFNPYIERDDWGKSTQQFEFFDLEDSEGTCTLIASPTPGAFISVYGNDEITGEQFASEIHVDFEPNPAIDIDVALDKSVYYRKEEMKVNYEIRGVEGAITNTRFVLLYRNKGSSLIRYNEDYSINDAIGTLTMGPPYCDYAYIYLQGYDSNGNSFFWISNAIAFKNPENLEPITCTINILPKQIYMGDTINVSYRITGGSGTYSNLNIHLNPFITSDDGWGKTTLQLQVIDLYEYEGTCVFSAPPVNSAYINLAGDDDVTGEHFSVDRYIEIDQKPDISVNVRFNRDSYLRREPIEIHYIIQGLEADIQEAHLTWLYGQKTASSSVGGDVPLERKEGIINYTLPYCDYAYAYIQGTDLNGNSFFWLSDRIHFKDVTDDDVQILPMGLKRIESEAFASTSIVAVEVPESVVFIADDAFSGSRVRLIIGESEYVKDYALNHNMIYREK